MPGFQQQVQQATEVEYYAAQHGVQHENFGRWRPSVLPWVITACAFIAALGFGSGIAFALGLGTDVQCSRAFPTLVMFLLLLIGWKWRNYAVVHDAYSHERMLAQKWALTEYFKQLEKASRAHMLDLLAWTKAHEQHAISQIPQEEQEQSQPKQRKRSKVSEHEFTSDDFADDAKSMITPHVRKARRAKSKITAQGLIDVILKSFK